MSGIPEGIDHAEVLPHHLLIHDFSRFESQTGPLRNEVVHHLWVHGSGAKEMVVVPDNSPDALGVIPKASTPTIGALHLDGLDRNDQVDELKPHSHVAPPSSESRS